MISLLEMLEVVIHLHFKTFQKRFEGSSRKEVSKDVCSHCRYNLWELKQRAVESRKRAILFPPPTHRYFLFSGPPFRIPLLQRKRTSKKSNLISFRALSRHVTIANRYHELKREYVIYVIPSRNTILQQCCRSVGVLSTALRWSGRVSLNVG